MGIERELHFSTPYEFLIQVNFKLKGYLDILQYRSFRFSALVKKDDKIFQNALNWKVTLTSCNISLFVSEHLLKEDDKIFENAFFHEYFIYTGKISPNCTNLLVF